MLNNRLTRSALVGTLWLPLLACSGSTGGGTGGALGSGGAANGGMTGTGGAHDAGPPNDAGHDTSSGGCWTSSDCHGGSFCSPPGQQVCGGACPAVTDPCASDTECATDAGAPRVCEIEPCACGPTNMGCVPGCTSNAECLEGQSCGANHHCVPTACGSAGQTCPTDFVCSTSAGTCVRKPCTSDSQCSNACVLGSCYHSPGACRLAVP